jgi:hypothetical protein
MLSTNQDEVLLEPSGGDSQLLPLLEEVAEETQAREGPQLGYRPRAHSHSILEEPGEMQGNQGDQRT